MKLFRGSSVKGREVPINARTLYVSGMRLLFKHPFGLDGKTLRNVKRVKKKVCGKGFSGVYSVGEVCRSIRCSYPAERDLYLTIFYGLMFARAFDKPFTAFVEFSRDLICDLSAKIRVPRMYVPGRRMYSILPDKYESALVYDGRLIKDGRLPRDKVGIPIPPKVELLYVLYSHETRRGYLFYIGNVNRLVGGEYG